MPFHWRNKGTGRLCLSWAFDQMTFGLEACCKLGCLGCSTCSCHFMPSRLATWGFSACTVQLAGPFKLIDFECLLPRQFCYRRHGIHSEVPWPWHSRSFAGGHVLVQPLDTWSWFSSFPMNHFSTCLCLFGFTKKGRERETGRERERESERERDIYIYIYMF